MTFGIVDLHCRVRTLLGLAERATAVPMIHFTVPIRYCCLCAVRVINGEQFFFRTLDPWIISSFDATRSHYSSAMESALAASMPTVDSPATPGSPQGVLYVTSFSVAFPSGGASQMAK